MRCKVGDLCVVVKTYVSESNRGKLVKILRPSSMPDRDWVCETMSEIIGKDEFGNIEIIVNGGRIRMFDHALRPIRDQEGDDEMIGIAGLPNKSKEIA